MAMQRKTQKRKSRKRKAQCFPSKFIGKDTRCWKGRANGGRQLDLRKIQKTSSHDQTWVGGTDNAQR